MIRSASGGRKYLFVASHCLSPLASPGSVDFSTVASYGPTSPRNATVTPGVIGGGLPPEPPPPLVPPAPPVAAPFTTPVRGSTLQVPSTRQLVTNCGRVCGSSTV